jgi:hypothetical protein
MATTSIGAPGVTFPDGSVQSTKGAAGDVIMNVYTSLGTSTWTKPATIKSIKVTVVGGGGSGGTATRGAQYPSMLQVTRNGASTGGGGGGGYAQKTYPAATLPGPQPFTVGGAATASSFGGPAPIVSATGGSSSTSLTGAPGPSTSTNNGVGAAGGAGSGGSLNIPGGYGGGAGNQLGGSSVLSTQSSENIANATGISGVIYGGGGTGASAGASSVAGSFAGGTGAQGVVIVEEFY